MWQLFRSGLTVGTRFFHGPRKLRSGGGFLRNHLLRLSTIFPEAQTDQYKDLVFWVMLNFHSAQLARYRAVLGIS